MNYKLMKKLSGIALVAGSAAAVGGGAFVAIQSLTKSENATVSVSATNEVNGPAVTHFEHIKYSINVDSVKDEEGNVVTGVHSLTINNADDSKGIVTFADGSTTNEFAVGQKIVIKVNILNEDYTVRSVKVHSSSNVDDNGIGNINLGIKKESDSAYSFVLPEETLPNGEKNPFYKGGNLKVDVTWTLKQINAYEYTWLDDTDGGIYSMQLSSDDFIFDDIADPNLKMEAAEGYDHTIFRIYMNGHDMQIKNMTIPAGVQLMFINNQDNTTQGKTPVVSLTKDSTFTEYKVKGGIGRWGSCDFSEELKTILNLNIYKGWLA